MIIGYFYVIPIALIIPIIMIVETGAITNFLTPVFATAGVTEQQFTAKLFGDMEVPPIETNATGLAEFRPILNENTVTYTLNVTDIDNVTAAHIHSGEQGQNGPIVVTLFKPDMPTPKMVSGLLSEGDISADNLEGPLAGKQLSELLSSMHSMGVYVNIHTTHYLDGEIRGQISNSTSGMMMK
ncbi:MAG: CHRD domain-containing protein [Nitrososphaeraceae archaeon]